jgi:hypothetical protein
MTYVTIKCCDPTDEAARDRMLREIQAILQQFPNAKLEWLQSSAATSSFTSHRLTAIITTWRGAAP